jgi:Uncharacterized protein conserved in bacteria
MRSARLLVIAAAAAALVMLLSTGPGTRLGLWPWQTGIALVRWAAYTGMAAGAMALVLLLLHALPRWRPLGLGLPVMALLMSAAAFGPPLYMLSQAKKVPPIHDITTDPEHPPQFVALLPERRKAPNGFEYGGPDVAAQQARAYLDIVSRNVPLQPADALQHSLDAARSLGWRIVATDGIEGRIEATATTTWFGFEDDIVIRVQPAGQGSRVDIRSASRVGRSDLGANAKRIREFLAKLT